MTSFTAVLSVIIAANIHLGVLQAAITVKLTKPNGDPSDAKEVWVFIRYNGEARCFVKMKSLGKGEFRRNDFPDSLKEIEMDIKNKNNAKIVRAKKRPKNNTLEITLTKEEEERKDDTQPRVYSQYPLYCYPTPGRISKWVPETCERSDGMRVTVYRPVYETSMMERTITIPPRTRYYYRTRYSDPYYYPRPNYYPYYYRPMYYPPSGRGTAFFPLFR